MREPRSVADVLAWLWEAADTETGPPTQEQAQGVWNLMRHPATSRIMLALQAWERGENYAKVAAQRDALQARLDALLAPARMDKREFAGDPVVAWRAYHEAHDHATMLAKRLAGAVGLLGEIRERYAALGEDAEGPHPLVDRIDTFLTPPAQGDTKGAPDA